MKDLNNLHLLKVSPPQFQIEKVPEVNKDTRYCQLLAHLVN